MPDTSGRSDIRGGGSGYGCLTGIAAEIPTVLANVGADIAIVGRTVLVRDMSVRRCVSLGYAL